MKLLQIVFSPTSGTQKAADAITEAWQGCVSKIDLTDAENDFSSAAEEQGDLALIAVPSYGGRVPALAAKRLSDIKGSGAKCVLVCVYGNRAYEDTLAELYDIAENCGFTVIAAVSAVAEHSIVRKYAAGRPDAQDKKELYGFAKRVFEKFASGDASPAKVPGNRPYKKTGGVTLVPRANKNCTGCALCAESCPARAIDGDNVISADKQKCISCMRCVKVCPASARGLNRAALLAASAALKKACSARKDNELFI